MKSTLFALTLLGLASTAFANTATPIQTDPNFTATAELNATLAMDASGSYYNWGRGMNGWGYCYHYTSDGRVLNGGSPVANSYCEYSRPSYYDWGRGMDGWGYCYQYTANGIAMNEGNAVFNSNCERTKPSHFSWGTGQNGYTYCYQYTPYGVAMNAGQAVSNSYCQ